MDNNKNKEAALTKQIKTLVLQGRYEEAQKALEDIDIHRIRNNSILCLVGETYMGLERYDEAERVLLRVYERQPNTRRILDLLTNLYIYKEEYSEAEYYYKEFIGVASKDLHRYILRYRLDKAKGERLSVLIDTLEKLKDYEYIEEWAYELALLYHASGQTKKCLHECDEIALWFGHGEYVDKATVLKCSITGEPLPESLSASEEEAETEAGEQTEEEKASVSSQEAPAAEEPTVIEEAPAAEESVAAEEAPAAEGSVAAEDASAQEEAAAAEDVSAPEEGTVVTDTEMQDGKEMEQSADDTDPSAPVGEETGNGSRGPVPIPVIFKKSDKILDTAAAEPAAIIEPAQEPQADAAASQEPAAPETVEESPARETAALETLEESPAREAAVEEEISAHEPEEEPGPAAEESASGEAEPAPAAHESESEDKVASPAAEEAAVVEAEPAQEAAPEQEAPVPETVEEAEAEDAGEDDQTALQEEPASDGTVLPEEEEEEPETAFRVITSKIPAQVVAQAIDDLVGDLTEEEPEPAAQEPAAGEEESAPAAHESESEDKVASPAAEEAAAVEAEPAPAQAQPITPVSGMERPFAGSIDLAMIEKALEERKIHSIAPQDEQAEETGEGEVDATMVYDREKVRLLMKAPGQDQLPEKAEEGLPAQEAAEEEKSLEEEMQTVDPDSEEEEDAGVMGVLGRLTSRSFWSEKKNQVRDRIRNVIEEQLPENIMTGGKLPREHADIESVSEARPAPGFSSVSQEHPAAGTQDVPAEAEDTAEHTEQTVSASQEAAAEPAEPETVLVSEEEEPEAETRPEEAQAPQEPEEALAGSEPAEETEAPAEKAADEPDQMTGEAAADTEEEVLQAEAVEEAEDPADQAEAGPEPEKEQSESPEENVLEPAEDLQESEEESAREYKELAEAVKDFFSKMNPEPEDVSGAGPAPVSETEAEPEASDAVRTEAEPEVSDAAQAEAEPEAVEPAREEAVPAGDDQEETDEQMEDTDYFNSLFGRIRQEAGIPDYDQIEAMEAETEVVYERETPAADKVSSGLMDELAMIFSEEEEDVPEEEEVQTREAETAQESDADLFDDEDEDEDEIISEPFTEEEPLPDSVGVPAQTAAQEAGDEEEDEDEILPDGFSDDAFLFESGGPGGMTELSWQPSEEEEAEAPAEPEEEESEAPAEPEEEESEAPAEPEEEEDQEAAQETEAQEAQEDAQKPEAEEAVDESEPEEALEAAQAPESEEAEETAQEADLPDDEDEDEDEILPEEAFPGDDLKKELEGALSGEAVETSDGDADAFSDGDEDEDETIPDEDEDEDEIIPDEDEDEDEIITEGAFAEPDDFLTCLFGAARDLSAGSREPDLLQEETGAEDALPDASQEEDDEILPGMRPSDTVMDIFQEVAGVRSIQQQLTQTFTKFEDPSFDSIDLLAPYDINFVVTGEDMSVKSQIAIGIAKALNTYGICDKNKLVRATADDLNARDFSTIFPKLSGGCLIIENADQLNERAAGIIAAYVQEDGQDVSIVMAGEEAPLMKMFVSYPVLRSKFLNIIHIGKYNEAELVQLAAGYAKKNGYSISPEARMVLERIIRRRMDAGSPVNYDDIMAIVDDAVASLEHRNMKNLFMTVLDNKYEEAAMFLIQPEDLVSSEPGR